MEGGGLTDNSFAFCSLNKIRKGMMEEGMDVFHQRPVVIQNFNISLQFILLTKAMQLVSYRGLCLIYLNEKYHDLFDISSSI